MRITDKACTELRTLCSTKSGPPLPRLGLPQVPSGKPFLTHQASALKASRAFLDHCRGIRYLPVSARRPAVWGKDTSPLPPCPSEALRHKGDTEQELEGSFSSHCQPTVAGGDSAQGDDGSQPPRMAPGGRSGLLGFTPSSGTVSPNRAEMKQWLVFSKS